MKNPLLILTTSLLTLSGFAQVPNYVPTNGLVGFWPFNGNANDESGNGNNGTVNGAVLISDRNGQSSSAYNFDVDNWSFGSGGDNIYIPYNLSFNFNDFTISTWVKRTSAGSTISSQTLSIIKRFQYGYNNPNGESWALEVAHGTNSSGSVLYGTVFEQSPSPAQSFYSQSNQIVPLNQWCNIIMTYSQNTINLYINNQLVGTASDPNVTINTVGNSGISIGLSEQANGQWSPFDGSIDDIGIWNRALTQCEIHDLYLAELNSLAVSGGSDVTICAGDVLTLNGSGASNYSWSNGISDGIPHVFTQMDLGNNELILTGIDANGCIGMDTVNVLVNNTSSSTLTERALDSYTLNGQTYTQSGIYTQVIPNAAGCDSTITLNLSLNFTGISDLENDFTIAPNPTMEFVTITSSDALYDEYVLFDPQGRKVLSGTLTGTTTQLNLSKLSRGNYLLQIGEKKTPIKLIKQ